MPNSTVPAGEAPLMAAWLVVLLYVVAILTIIVVHEAGHFLTAKAFGIKVQEFFVGFGPRLWSFRRGETEYGVKALPLGGYVRIAGMNPYEEIPEADLPRTFGAKPLRQRAVVILAGPVTHFVMAVLLLAVFFSAVGIPILRPAIGRVCALNERSRLPCPRTGERSPAQRAGLRAGDRILAVDGRPVKSSDELVAYTRRHVGEEVELRVRRGDRTLTLEAEPMLSRVGGERVGRLGVILAEVEIGRVRTDPFTALGRGVSHTIRLGRAVVLHLGQVFGPSGLRRIGELLTGREPPASDRVVSVVGGARLAIQAAEAGAWDALLQLLVVFNVFIGILNLVPLPPLDGGHLAVLAYEKLRGRRPDVRKLVPVTVVVAAFMILFAISVTYLDIVNPVPNPFR